MAALDFPASPTDGQTYTANGKTWVYRTATGSWQATGSADTSRYWWVDPLNGNDTTGLGTQASPYATIAKVITVYNTGDTVRFPPFAKIIEPYTWSMPFDGAGVTYLNALHFEGDPTAPAIFQCFDKHTGSWTNDGTGNNTYSGTFVRTWYSTTVTPAFTAGQAMSYRILLGSAQLQEIQYNASTPYANLAAALAYVRATPGTFVVDGYDGSTMYKGWRQANGNTDTVYIHAADNAAPNASGRVVSIGQRPAPYFARGSKISNIIFMGGIFHNGVQLRGCEVKNCKIMFPLHHATFINGAQLFDCEVYGGNKWQGGYAYHLFDIEGMNDGRTTKLVRCSLVDYYGAFNVAFGGHGTGAAGYLCDLVEVDDFYAYNVDNLGSCGGIRNGWIFRRPRLINVASSGSMDSTVFEDPIIIQGSAPAVNGGWWGSPTAGTSVSVYGGTSSIRENALIGVSTTGTLNFYGHHALVGGDLTNLRWWTSSSTGAVTFNKCILAADYGADAAHTLYMNASAAINLNLVDCHVSGLTCTGSNITLADTGTTYGGNPTIRRGTDGAVVLERNNYEDSLGLAMKGVLSHDVAFYWSPSNIYVTTSKGVFTLNTNDVPVISWAAPAGAVITGCVNTLATAPSFSVIGIIYGKSGFLYRQVAGTYTASAATPSTKNWIGHVDNYHADRANNVTILIADDGTYWRYNPNADTLTACAMTWTASAFQLTGGFDNGTDILMWGGDGYGATAGSYGGVTQSTDGGATFTQILSSASAVPSGIGNLARKVTCGGYVNGIWTLFGNGSTYLTGTKGATYTASIATTVMTVTGTPVGVIQVGDAITGTGVTGGTTISSLGTGTGGAGTYNVSASQTVASTTITSTNTKVAFTSRNLYAEVDVANCRVDNNSGHLNTYKKLLFSGSGIGDYAGSSKVLRSTKLFSIDANPSATDPSTWIQTELISPLPGISSLAHISNWQKTGAAAGIWIAAGKVGEFSYSSDGKNWVYNRIPRYGYATLTYAATREGTRTTQYLPA